ncbi:MAG TPA: polyribonucleotide nucleotidyltransferase, partial [bacterium]
MIRESVRIGARTLELETGRIARQAHGAVLLREGNAVVLATAVYNPGQQRAVDFLPLTVDYREYMSAAGRIPGGFLRREGRASDREVLASRLCDRSIRPLFPKGYRLETQVISTVLSHGAGSDSPVLAMIAAAAALHLSEIPWQGPLAAVRIARVDGALIALPSAEELARAELDLVVSLGHEGLVMIEGGARQVPDADVLEALAFAEQAVAPLLEAMEALRRGEGKPKTTLAPLPEPPAALAALEGEARGQLAAALAVPDKQARRA